MSRDASPNLARVLLHVGQQKTGSKALQSALRANAAFLGERGFAYPLEAGIRRLRPHEMNHYPLFRTLRAALAGDRSEAESTGMVRDHLRRLLSRRRSPGDTVILSSEDLFDMHTAHEPDFDAGLVASGPRLLSRALDDIASDVTVACYLRRQDHLLGARYAEFIKGSGTNHLDFAEFRRFFERRLDHDEMLAHWEEAFGVDRVEVASYEPREMPDGIVGDFFARFLGAGLPPNPEPFPEDRQAFNATPSRDHVEYVRCLNRRSARGRDVLDRSRVLEAAFHERGSSGPSGIAAWLSPGERIELLARHEEGNRRIALRHGLRDGLFREPLPDVGEGGGPVSPPDLTRLVEIEARSRREAGERPRWRRMLGHLRSAILGRQAWWIVPPEAGRADTELATLLFEGIAGSPVLESGVLRSVQEIGGHRRDGRRTTLLVLVGPSACDVRLPDSIREPRASGARVVLLLGDVPLDAGRIEAVRRAAASLDLVVCASRERRDEIVAAVPGLGALPVHPRGGDDRPRIDLLEQVVRT